MLNIKMKHILHVGDALFFFHSVMPEERMGQCSASWCPDANTQRLTATSGNSANLLQSPRRAVSLKLNTKTVPLAVFGFLVHVCVHASTDPGTAFFQR